MEHRETAAEHRASVAADKAAEKAKRARSEDKELQGVLDDAEERKAQVGADGMTFIDWHNSAGDLVAKRQSRAIANGFNRTRKDTGSLAERFDHAVKVLERVLKGEDPKEAAEAVDEELKPKPEKVSHSHSHGHKAEH